MVMDWSWAVGGVSDNIPRTTGPECVNYMTNRRRLIEGILVSLICLAILRWAVKRLQPIIVPAPSQTPPSVLRRLLLVTMTFTFGLEMGFKLSTRTVIFTLNPCHIQTMIQIYLLAARPSKTTIALFRIQMNYLNGPFLAFLFPEADTRSLPLEQFTYWMQHGLLFIIPVYLIKSGAYRTEDIMDFNWNVIGVTIMLLYHFILLGGVSVIAGINLNHMLCAALADPFQGQQYRIAAIIHETILCPFLNKSVTILFSSSNQIQLDVKIIKNNSEIIYKEYDNQKLATLSAAGLAAATTSRIDDQIMTTKID